MSGASGKMNAPITIYGNGYLGDRVGVEIDHTDGTVRHPNSGGKPNQREVICRRRARDGVHGAVSCGVDRHDDQVATGNARARASSVSSWAASPSVTHGASSVTFERQPAK